MTAKATAKARYELLESGAIERIDPEDGQRLLVARLEEGKLSFITTQPRVRMVVRRFLTENNRPFTETTPEEIAAGPAPETVKPSETSKDWREGLNPEQVKAMIRLRREHGFPDVEVEKTNQRFVRTSKLGDKDPEYVLWLLRYKPAKFARIYGIIGQAIVTKYRTKKDPESLATKKIAYRENCVMTKRKTHLTERPSVVGGPGTQAPEEGQDDGN